MTRKIILLILLTLSVAMEATAQRCRIFGTVKDQDGNPIELANVYIVGTTIGTSCNLKGEYSLTFESRDTLTV